MPAGRASFLFFPVVGRGPLLTDDELAFAAVLCKVKAAGVQERQVSKVSQSKKQAARQPRQQGGGTRQRAGKKAKRWCAGKAQMCSEAF